MDMNDIPAATKPSGWWTRLALKITGVDGATLRQCPPADWDNVKAVAAIMVATWIYQTALFSLIGHQLFAAPGAIRLDLIAAAAFIASFVLLIDSYMVMRSGWYSSGIEELKRGGLDISGGWAERIKAGLFLAIRILLSVSIAQLTAIFLSLLIFGADVTAQLHMSNLQANSELLTRATAAVDADIQRVTAAADAEATRYETMAAQVAALRQNQIDPAAGDAQVRQAQQELNALLAEKKAADEAVTAAETFSTNELGGIKGSQDNTGVVGDGIRHKAAIQRVAEARAHAAAIASEVNAARSRLDAIHNQRGAVAASTRQMSKDQLPGFEQYLAQQEARLTTARNERATLTADRDEAIRQAEEQAPGFVPPETGLLGQMKALERVAEADPKIKAVIILIDLVSFSFELAAVLAKVTSYCPTTYSALLVADSYAQVVRIVEELMRKLDDASASDPSTSDLLPSDPTEGEAAEQAPHHRPGFPAAPDPFSSAVEQPRRPRGRPRKVPMEGLN